MRHGYTNDTVRSGDVVVKRYSGPDAEERASVERRALTFLEGEIPVPRIVDSGPSSITTTFVVGDHGQDLIDEGHASSVLAACGRVLRRLHALPPQSHLDHSSAGVMVHGDFGPNNVLLSPGGEEVTAVLDWEFCHTGRPVEDLAWCEWIVREHHPVAIAALRRFFDTYGWTPTWIDRSTEMVRRCVELEAMCRRSDPGGAGEALWRERAARAAGWAE